MWNTVHVFHRFMRSSQPWSNDYRYLQSECGAELLLIDSFMLIQVSRVVGFSSPRKVAKMAELM
jgi:hypothetical protein